MKLLKRLTLFAIFILISFSYVQLTYANEQTSFDAEESEIESVNHFDEEENLSSTDKLSETSSQDHSYNEKARNDTPHAEIGENNDSVEDTAALESQKKEDVNQLYNTFTNNHLKYGDRNSKVLKLKRDLIKIGFGTHWKNPTNYYGSDTERVVQEFQAYYSLVVDGVMGPNSLTKLDEVVSGPYQLGKRSNRIKEIKLDLMNLGFGTHWTNPTTYYGSDTEKVVRKFQNTHSLVVNGIVDEVTLRKIESLISQPLQLGVRRGDVIELKKDLMKIGFGTHWTNPTTYYGPDTERVVREFQSYYGLVVDGVMGPNSLAKLDGVISSPYQLGKRSNKIKEIKLDLVNLGFGTHWTNPTTYFGSDTEREVRKFQNNYSLVVNGIVDEVTLRKIESLIAEPFQLGVRRADVVELKKDLMKIGFGTHWTNPTTYYGPDTDRVAREFQAYYGLAIDGVMGPNSLAKLKEVISSPYQLGKRSNKIKEIKHNLVYLGFGTHWTNPTTYYGNDTKKVVEEFQSYYKLIVNGIIDEVTLFKINSLLENEQLVINTPYEITLQRALELQLGASPQTDRKYAWISKTYIKDNKVTASSLNVRIGPGTSHRSLGLLSEGDKVNILDEYNGWYVIDYKHNTQWVHASPSDVLYYLNPINFVNDNKQVFQFLDLSKPSGTTARVLDNYLKGKGILKDKGQAFIDAGRMHGINDIYLLSHSLLETGNGTSQLSQGVEVGINSKGDLELVTSNNKNSLTKVKKVYNMFGIGAYDSCALECGAKKAYEEDWTSPEKAITGGAAFIGNDYIKAGQNTLFKMRWNPLAMERYGYATHQYATDVGWASKQITTMYNLYQEIGSYRLYLDIPVFK